MGPPHHSCRIDPLLRTWSRCHFLLVGFSSPPAQKQKAFRHSRFRSEKYKLPRRGRSLPAPVDAKRRVSLLTRRRIQPPADGAVRLCRRLASGGVCLRARTSRLSIASLPLRHEWYSSAPDAPHTIQLYRKAFATRSSKNVSLLGGASGRTPARKTHPTRNKPARACLTVCCAEATRGTEVVYVCVLYKDIKLLSVYDGVYYTSDIKHMFL